MVGFTGMLAVGRLLLTDVNVTWLRQVAGRISLTPTFTADGRVGDEAHASEDPRRQWMEMPFDSPVGRGWMGGPSN